MRSVAAIVVIVCAGAGTAAGQVAPDADHTVVSLPIMALSSNALAVQAERPLARRISLAVTLAGRDGADGDYQATTVGVAGELRLWLRPRQHGWFVAPRLELSRTELSRSGAGRSLGSALVIGEGIMVGYRLAIRRRVELTPSLGIVVRHDLVAGGVPDATRGSPVFGVSLGWIFGADS